MSDGSYVDDFLLALKDLGWTPSGSVTARAEALEDDAPGATKYQLAAAVKALRSSWKMVAFPTHEACVAAIRAAPVREMERRSASERPVAISACSEAPALVRAREYRAAYEAADEAQKAWMDRQWPGLYSGSVKMIEAFGRS